MALTGFQPLILGAHTVVTELSTVVTLTKPDSGDALQIQAFANNVRVTMDGTTPTASVGFQLTAGQLYQIDVGINSVIKIIEEEASASLQYQWMHTRRDIEA